MKVVLIVIVAVGLTVVAGRLLFVWWTSRNIEN